MHTRDVITALRQDVLARATSISVRAHTASNRTALATVEAGDVIRAALQLAVQTVEAVVAVARVAVQAVAGRVARLVAGSAVGARHFVAVIDCRENKIELYFFCLESLQES